MVAKNPFGSVFIPRMWLLWLPAPASCDFALSDLDQLWSELAGQLGFVANAEPAAPSTNPQILTTRPFVKTHDPAVFVNHDGGWSRALERWMQGRAPF